jgi:competence protein ComEC
MADPACWQRQAGVVLATGAAGPPLLAGQRLASAGLAVQALAMDSQALRLSLGDHRWLLLPDRQALWSWQTRGEALPAGLWLGFQPQLRDRQVLRAPALRQVWVSGPPPAPLPPGWRATGARGSLQTGVG